MLKEKPDAIVITFPVQFLLDLGYSKYIAQPEEDRLPFWDKKSLIMDGYYDLLRQLDHMEKNPDNNIWNHSIGNKPTHEVLHAYITILGVIHYRAKIVGWEAGHEKQFEDGRKRTAKHWLLLADFVKAPEVIPFKGCQGFRYTEKLF